MLNGQWAVQSVLLSVLIQLPSISHSATRPFWVCVGVEGVRKGQDRACAASEQTLSAPPGNPTATSNAKVVSSTAPPVASRPLLAARPTISLETASAHSLTSTSRPNLFAPMIEIVLKGFGTIALVLLAVGAIKVLLALAIKRAKHEASTSRDRKRSRAAGPIVTSRTKSKMTPSWEHRGDLQTQQPDQPPPRVTPTVRTSTSSPTDRGWNIELIRELEWKRFEELCMQFWSRKGYPARLTEPGADGGVDVVIADQRDPARVFAVAQCKSWASKPVGVDPVRALWGAKDHFKANLALFYGLSGFTPDARAFAEGKHLKLISGDELLLQIKSMPEQVQATLLADVTRGDYTTPTCPTCDIKMYRRSGKNGKADFWGCNNFRRCGAKPIPCRVTSN